jgi:ribose/xylose/arabinose/galactoside ABC-type transport system permease subunit
MKWLSRMKEDMKKRLYRLRRPETGTVAALLVVVAVFYIMSRGLFFSPANLAAVMRVAAQLGIITVGQALLMIAGEFDLSVGSVYGFAGVLFIGIQRSLHPLLSILIVLAFMLIIGLLNGFFVFKLKIPSLIATLGGLFTYRGLIYFITGGFGVHISEQNRASALVRLLGSETFGGTNNIFIWFLASTVVCSVVLTCTRFGNRVYAVGDEPLSAFSRGVSPIRVKWICFMICSLTAGVSGIATVCNSGTAYPTMGSELELQSIASSVVGGIALSGGVGTVWGAAVGAFFLSTIKSGLILIGAPPYWFITFVGVVLIAAVAINRVLSERRRY